MAKLLKTFFLALLFLHCHVKGDEPQCSKFHYEEQMLEKMIRTQIKFEEMKKQVEDRLQDMEEQSKRRLMEAENQDDRIKEMEKKVMVHESKNEKDASESDMKITDLTAVCKRIVEKEIRNKDLLRVPHVSFKSHDLDYLDLQDSQILKFKTTMYNHGGGYDDSTGIFTAPEAGTYIFTANLCMPRALSVLYEIAVDNVTVSMGEANWSSYRRLSSCDTTQAIVPLNATSEVWVYYVLRNSGGRFGSTREEDGFSAFSGVLINNFL